MSLNHRRHVVGDHHADDCIGVSRENLGHAKKIVFTRFPLFTVAVENVLRAFHAERSPKDTTDFRRLHRFPIRQEKVFDQRQVHFFGLLPSQTQLTELDSSLGNALRYWK